MASRALNLAMRSFQFLCTLIIMGLIGNMIATSRGGNHSIVNYNMFVSVFSMLSLFYLIPATFFENAAIPLATIALDALNTLFFLCGAIATAAYLGVHSCSNSSYIRGNPITNNINPEKRCREAQASTAFLWFGFAAFAASTVFSALQGRGSANLRSGGLRRGGPSMSQV